MSSETIHKTQNPNTRAALQPDVSFSQTTGAKTMETSKMSTALQQVMIVKIAEDLMNSANGKPENHRETETWADGIIESPEDKGVFTSLLNAKLVWHSGEKQDAGCGLTESGFDEYKRIKESC
jgi:hypothetical protein